MVTFLRSATTAVCIAAAIQCFTVGYLAPRIPLQVCRPYVEQAELFFILCPAVPRTDPTYMFDYEHQICDYQYEV